MNRIQFNIIATNALSPGLINEDDWQTWSHLQCQWPQECPAPPANAIPAMMRRRVSSLSKLALQAAITLTREQSVDYVVFSSRHGELERTVKLLLEIQNGGDASPIAFSQSVHNTAAGLYTIATKRPVPATSIAAGPDSFHCALVEAAIYLDENPGCQVLVVDFDAPLPEPYRQFDPVSGKAYAFAMLLGSGNSCEIIRQPSDTPAPEADQPQALSCYHKMLSGEKSWQIDSPRHHWHWTLE